MVDKAPFFTKTKWQTDKETGVKRKASAVPHSEVSLDKNNPNPAKNRHKEIRSRCGAVVALSQLWKVRLIFNSDKRNEVPPSQVGGPLWRKNPVQ